jgi:hypothetical protein
MGFVTGSWACFVRIVLRSSLRESCSLIKQSSNVRSTLLLPRSFAPIVVNDPGFKQIPLQTKTRDDELKWINARVAIQL